MLKKICCIVQKIKSKLSNETFVCGNCFTKSEPKIDLATNFAYSVRKVNEMSKKEWLWELKNSNEQVIAKSKTVLTSKKKANYDVDFLKINALGAKIIKKSEGKEFESTNRFEYYENESKKWVWEFKDEENDILAVGDGFDTEVEIKEMLEEIKRKFNDDQK